MQRRDNEENTSVALYWDFENLHASLCEAQQEGAYSKPDNTLIGIGARRYTNWHWAKSYEFRYYENLAGTEAPVVEHAAVPAPVAPADTMTSLTPSSIERP